MKKAYITTAILAALGLGLVPAANAGTFGNVSGSSMVSASGGTGGFYFGGPGYVYPGAGHAMAGDTAYGNAHVRMNRHNVVTNTSAGTQGVGKSSWTGYSSFMGSASGNAGASFSRGWGGWGGWGG